MEDKNLQRFPRQNDGVEEEEEDIVSGGGETSRHMVINIGDGTKNPEPRPSSFVLSFSNLGYSIKLRPKLTFRSLFARTAKSVTKTILNDISGEARDGKILALVGASGSGKSTMLDALANRIAKGSLKGTVTLNGEIIDTRISKSITAYVMQDDLLYPMLTVEETLMFAAEFRLPRKIGESTKKERVHELIDQLGLRSAAKTIIGDEGHRGVSGGERRRVSIGVDIIHDPILLFLDEPTSGLDSTSAFTVVKVLKRIARSGSVVVMSIHQPSYRILDFLDRLIVLSRGEVVYRGSPTSLPLFFSNFDRPIPANANGIEFVLDLISELEDSTDGVNGLVEFNKTWQSRYEFSDQIGDQNVTPLKEALNLRVSKGKLLYNENTNFRNVSSFANPLWIEILVLIKRSMTNSRRSSAMFFTQMITNLTTGLFLASLFWKLDNSYLGVRERLGFFAFAITVPYISTCQYLPVYLQERYIFIRETAYNTYRRSSYVLSRILVDFPTLLVFAIAFAAATFWAVGLAGGLAGFFFYFLVICSSFWAGNSIVVFISGLVPNILIGFTIVLSVATYCVLFCGFFITRDRIPPYWIWFHYISVIKYPYEALMRSEFEGRPGQCFARGAEMFDNTPFAGVSAAVKAKLLGDLGRRLAVNVTSSTCMTTGSDVLRKQAVSHISKWESLLVVGGWCFFFWVLFYLSLSFGTKNKNVRK